MSFELIGSPLQNASMTTTASPILAIRFATDEDAADVIRLGRLDSSHAPQGRVLLGVVDGETRAALSIEDGHVVADPFHPTADVIALLALRAARLRDADQGAALPGRARSLLRRTTPRRRVTSTA